MFLSFVPCLTYGFIFFSEQHNLDMKDTNKKFGSIISGLKTESLYVLMQPMLYFTRRLLFVMIL